MEDTVTTRDKRRKYNREQQTKWRAANAEKALETVRKYRAANPEKMRAAALKYREANRKKACAAVRKSQIKHPETKRAIVQRRRASIKTSVSNAPTAKQLAALMLDPCVYCGAKSEHVDHCIPLARGGTHTIDNLVPACAPCNLSKGSKLPVIEWNGRKRK